MFKTNRKSKIDPNSTDTLIGEGSVFEGKIKSEAGLRVEGRIVGDIDCTGDVTVGENGYAKSNIKARNVIIAGQVTGNISASGKLTIKATGQLYGNLSALELSIESGAIFQGLSKMDAKDSTHSPAAEDKTQSWEPEPKNAVAPADETPPILKTW